MKRSTAMRYCHEIHEKLTAIGGLLETPRGQRSHLQFLKVEVFGSTVKGTLEPNDLDLLIATEATGVNRSWEEVGFDPAYLRATGVRIPRDSKEEAYKWLTKGMRNVSRHDAAIEMIKIDKKIEIFPKYLMPDLTLSQQSSTSFLNGLRD